MTTALIVHLLPAFLIKKTRLGCYSVIQCGIFLINKVSSQGTSERQLASAQVQTRFSQWRAIPSSASLRSYSIRSRHILCLCLVIPSCLTLCDPMDCGLPVSSVRGILQAEYWSELPFPSPGDLANSEMEPRSPAWQTDSLSSELPGIQAELLCKKKDFHMVPLFSSEGQCFRYLETSWPVR